MEKTIISVVIPVYNNEKYISTAVDSVLKQPIESRDNIELIIVDDGSTDRTPQIVDAYKKADNRVRVIHQKNQWIYASMNNGIKEADGEYIFVLNSDDKFENGALLLLLNKIEEYDEPDMICTKITNCLVDTNQRVLSSHDYNPDVNIEEYFSTIDEIRNSLLYLQQSKLFTTQANLYKTSLLRKHPFREDVYGADTMINCQIAMDLRRMVVLPVPVYRFMIYEDKGNASINKYYAYQHSMFNELYVMYKELYEKCEVYDKRVHGYLVDERLKRLTYEISALALQSCELSGEEKIKKVFTEIADVYIRTEARKVGREKEYESRILNGTLNLIKKCNIELTGIIEFVKELLWPLPEFHLDNPKDFDRLKMIECVNDKLNIDKVGKKYYLNE